MIITRNVEILITNRNINHFKKIGLNISTGLFIVPTESLLENSTSVIEVKCDICEKIKKIKYFKYTKNISNGGYYACSAFCAKEKVKKTNNIKYGVDYPLQSIEKQKELKQYFINKYGVDNTSKLKDNKLKRIKTNLEKYGVENVFNLPEIRKRSIEKSCSVDSKNKRIKTNLEKYGVENYTKTQEYKVRFEKTSMLKYKEIHPMKCQEIKNKLKNSVILKYGVDHPMKIPELALKAGENSLIGRIKNGFSVDNNDLEKWNNYKNRVRKLTHRNKKSLFENWNGIDYYDKKEIKEFLLLDYMDENYPCVDHKNSILYGFKNKISVETISNIENLCITKRKINSKKGSNNDIIL